MGRHLRRAGWFERLDVRLALGVASLLLGGCGSGEEPTTTTGQGGAGGAGGGGGQGGNGGQVQLDVCVLNQGTPQGPCVTPAQLDYGAVPAGAQAMRLFRIDNATDTDAVFKLVGVSSLDFSVVTVRYDGDPGSLVRVAQPLPATRPPGTALYFEVTYTSNGVGGPLPADAVHVEAGPVGAQTADISVPIVGKAEACPPGKGACDSDPLNGCETDLGTDALNCGSCKVACALPSSCNDGTCENQACAAGFADCNLVPGDGCEQDILTSLENCGGCNLGCALANAAESCSGGSCLLGACAPGFANCDNNSTTGCESELASDAQHCGSCSNDCSTLYPHTAASCGSGVCSPGACLAGYVDLDSSPANGCEYACTYVGAVDVPDDGFVDENCDGIDGVVSQAIFVATTGNDSNAGTMAAPMLTVNGGIARALSTGKTQVYISQGLYDGRVTLANGVSLYGGYSQANGWARSASFIATIQSGTVSSGRVSAVEGSSITAATTVDRLTIKTLGTASVGVSSYAMACNGCTALTLKNSTLEAGDAGPGLAGVNGTNGAIGGGAGPSGGGSCTSNVSGGAGGLAGTSPCGRNGGAGGKGGDVNAANGSSGGSGVGGTLGGLGGSVGGAGAKGTNGTSGSVGNNGLGAGGGVVTMGFWLGTAGLNGVDGAPGNGGSGGGGGGASTVGAGNGGGGGAGGGCGGTGATGGTGGGGSFGLFLVSSTGFVMTNNTITSGNGGKGGNGGNGGLGGGGGGGTAGAQVCTSEVGAGGIGGHGGNGGRGGHGGGGAGGASFAVFRSVTTVDVAGNTLTGGISGNGGSSMGNSGAPGGSGALF